MHWSDPITLEPATEVPKLDGSGYTNRIALTRARDLGLLPRVTGVIDEMLGAGYGLQQYIRRTCILAAEGTVRDEDEDDAAYIERVDAEAKAYAASRRDRGKVVHEGVRAFLAEGSLSRDPAVCSAAQDIRSVIDKAAPSAIVPEKRLGGRRQRCTGQPDLYMEGCDLAALRVLCGVPSRFSSFASRERQTGNAIIDLKCTDLRSFKNPYKEHKYQLGGYAGLLGDDHDLKNTLLIHWYFDPARGGSRWILLEDTPRWVRAYACLLEAWGLETGYWG